MPHRDFCNFVFWKDSLNGAYNFHNHRASSLWHLFSLGPILIIRSISFTHFSCGPPSLYIFKDFSRSIISRTNSLLFLKEKQVVFTTITFWSFKIKLTWVSFVSTDQMVCLDQQNVEPSRKIKLNNFDLTCFVFYFLWSTYVRFNWWNWQIKK